MLVAIKYVLAFLILGAIILTPAYLARLNKKDKMNMGVVRFSSWLFGWTIIGWFIGLYWAVRK